MLQKEGLIDDRFVKMILGWRHVSGFSVHNGVRIRRDDAKGMESLAQYIIRSPFSLGKMQYVAESAKVIYRSKMTPGRNKRNFKIFDAEEFIAAITQHIPEKGFQLVRYYGWYSNRMRGDRLKEKFSSQEEKTTSDQDPVEIIDLSFLNRNRRKIPSPTWRECIKKIWEVDPLKCPRCHAEMKIISFINERRVIEKILRHLDLWEEERTVEQAGRAPPERRLRYEPFDDDWPGYEEPYIAVQ
jgi:hypothetical protein